MFTIRNEKDLRLAYFYVDLFAGHENEKDDPAAAKKAVIETKREIRRYLKQDNCSDRRLVKSFDDSYIELVELPEQIETMDIAEQYAKDFIKIPYRWTYYDCTGQLFTSWIKVFRRRGRFMAYHMVSADV